MSMSYFEIASAFKMTTNFTITYPAYLALLLVSILQSQCHILRLGCKGLANFSLENRGFRLDGSVIQEFQEVDLHECYEHCFFNSLCKSINIEKGDYGTCQLNNASAYDVMDFVALTANSKWNYRSTNFTDRLVGESCKAFDPCNRDQLCLDTCSLPGYECIDCVGNNRGLHCNRCASNPCRNGGVCLETEKNMCYCLAGYGGDFCETILIKGTCNFDFGYCTWTRAGDFKWSRKKSKQYTGKHLYIDASFPRKPGEKALLHHNFSFKDTAVYCLKFFYCINGTDAGQLNIYDGSVLIWSLAGSQGNSWSLATVSIMKSYGIRTTIVTIEGVRGNSYNGDIAIDDIYIKKEYCLTTPSTANPFVSYNPPKTACSSNPCQHSSTCVLSSDSPSGFKCLCDRYSTGPRCETDLGRCKRCTNSGYCLGGIDGYACTIYDKGFQWEKNCSYVELTPKETDDATCPKTCRPHALTDIYRPILDSRYNCLCLNSSWTLYSFLLNCIGEYNDIWRKVHCVGLSSKCLDVCSVRGFGGAADCNREKKCCRSRVFSNESQFLFHIR